MNKYILSASFPTPTPAPLPNPLPCDVGALTITDPNNLASINIAEELEIADGAGFKIMSQSNFDIIPGLAIIYHVRLNDGTPDLISMVGFCGTEADDTGNRLRFTTDGKIEMSYTSTFVDTGYTYETMVDYQVAIVLLETQAIYCITGGSYPNWIMIGTQPKSSSIYYPDNKAFLRLTSYNRVAAYKYINVVQLLAPWQSDSIITSGTLYPAATGALHHVDPNLLSIADIQALFNHHSHGVGVERIGNTYWLYQNQDHGRRWYIELNPRQSPSIIHVLRYSQIRDSNGAILANLNNDAFSVWEYAYVIPDYGWAGNAHGSDTELSLTFTIDSNQTTLNDGDSISGLELIATRISRISKPDTTLIADVTFTYTMNSTGMTAAGIITWRSGILPSWYHNAMMPTTEVLNTGRIGEYGRYWDLTLNTSDVSVTGPTLLSTLGVMFDRNGSGAAMMQSPDIRLFYVQDRSYMNKLYSQSNEATTFSTLYRAIYLDGANRLKC